jgi:hypothetical protein
VSNRTLSDMDALKWQLSCAPQTGTICKSANFKATMRDCANFKATICVCMRTAKQPCVCMRTAKQPCVCMRISKQPCVCMRITKQPCVYANFKASLGMIWNTYNERILDSLGSVHTKESHQYKRITSGRISIQCVGKSIVKARTALVDI